MGQVAVTGLPADTIPETQIADVRPQRTQRQELASAIQVINNSGVIPPDRQVTFSTDTATRTLVVHVVDRQSGKVVVQWPSEYALQMAQDYRKEHTKT